MPSTDTSTILTETPAFEELVQTVDNETTDLTDYTATAPAVAPVTIDSAVTTSIGGTTVATTAADVIVDRTDTIIGVDETMIAPTEEVVEIPDTSDGGEYVPTDDTAEFLGSVTDVGDSIMQEDF